jgi:hypothetical protein
MNEPMDMNRLTNRIIEYEEGNLSDRETLELFSDLIKSGLAWQLQGSYGRMARDLIKSGLLNNRGVIDWEKFEELTNGGGCQGEAI